MADITNIAIDVDNGTSQQGRSESGVVDESCREYCYSKFVTLHEPAVTRLTSDLQNEIHSIFSLPEFSDDDYDILEVPIRLASLLLESDVLLPYINTMMHGQLYMYTDGGPTSGTAIEDPKECIILHDEGDVDGFWEHACFPKDNQDEVNHFTKQQAKRELADMANIVGFAMGEMEDALVAANCSPLEGPLPLKLARKYPYGRRSLILLTKSFYEQLRQLTDAAEFPSLRLLTPWYTLERLLATWLKFAVFLVHETAHALNQAAGSGGSLSGEPYRKGAEVAEAGHQVETELFGGTVSATGWLGMTLVRNHCGIRMYEQHPKSFVCVTEHPSACVTRTYLDNEYPVTCRTNERPVFDRIWRIPLPWLEKLFTTHFWETEVREKGPAALKAPKDLGWTFGVDKIVGGECKAYGH